MENSRGPGARQALKSWKPKLSSPPLAAPPGCLLPYPTSEGAPGTTLTPCHAPTSPRGCCLRWLPRPRLPPLSAQSFVPSPSVRSRGMKQGRNKKQA